MFKCNIPSVWTVNIKQRPIFKNRSESDKDFIILYSTLSLQEIQRMEELSNHGMRPLKSICEHVYKKEREVNSIPCIHKSFLRDLSTVKALPSKATAEKTSANGLRRSFLKYKT